MHVLQRVLVCFALAIPIGCTPSESNVGSGTKRPRESFRTKYKALVRGGNFAGAEQLIVDHLVRRPSDTDVLLMAARLSADQTHWQAAVDRYVAYVDAGGQPDDSLQEEWTFAQCMAGDIYQAIDRIQALPNASTKTRTLLARLYGYVGDIWGLQTIHAELAEKGQATRSQLASLLNLRGPAETNDAIIQAALQRYPDDLRPMTAKAVALWVNRETEDAIDLAERIVTQHPKHTAAIGFLGYLEAKILRLDSLRTLVQTHDANEVNRPEYWYAVGVVQQDAERFDDAAASFLKCVRDPYVSILATGRLAAMFGALDMESVAKVFAQDEANLQKLRDTERVWLQKQSTSQLVTLNIAELLATVGRAAEANQWLKLAAAMNDEPVADASDRSKEIRVLARTNDRESLVTTLQAKFPVSAGSGLIVKTNVMSNPANDLSQPTVESLSPIRFVDQAPQRGFAFAYQHGEPDGGLGRWIHHITGGGAAVADFDLNGDPDIFVTQAGGHPNDSVEEKEKNTRDALFLNSDGLFKKSPKDALLSYGFGQGVAAGDVNDDGFADLLVANIGENRLLINRGDGTFQDVTEASGIEGNFWSSSMGIADIDLDGLNDLIEINYCELSESVTLPCYDEDNEMTSCAPIAFAPTRDRVWLSNGDGTFREEGIWDEPPQQGRGLGLLVGDLDGSGGMEVFITNDLSSNHWWTQDSEEWTETATIRGMAVGADGRAQGCMGIAWNDIDFDGDLDFLVTNFAKENNNFYVQRSNGYFVDRAVGAGLTDISYPMLGFGIHASDFDQDGFSEVFVANGLVNQNRGPGEPFRQPAQVLRYLGNQFHDDKRTKDTYLQTPHTGRAVAEGDFDNDGKMDLVVTQLGEPTNLLMNQSRGGRWIRFELIGANTPRDSIGAEIRVITDRRTRVLRRVAGYGYFASHQPVLTATLEPTELIQSIVIRWPDGEHQTMGPLPTNCSWQFVQGSTQRNRFAADFNGGNDNELSD